MNKTAIQKTDGNQLPSTDRSLPIALMRARETIMAPIREMLSSSDITEQQWRVLRILAEQGRIDGSQLAEKACLLLSSVTRITQTMVDKGLVSRTIDPDDRRRQLISIAPRGQKIIDDNLPRAIEIAAGFKNALGEKKYEMLLDLLQELDTMKN